MRNLWKIIIVLILASSVIAVVWLKKAENQSRQPQIFVSDSNDSPAVTVETAQPPVVSAVEPQKLPRLVDLGADKCIPCKMMAPVLEELKNEYKDKMQVDFYDVWKNPAPGKQYGIRVIPTQIFLSPDGKELFRHEGFFSKKDILAKWKEFGFEFNKKD